MCEVRIGSGSYYAVGRAGEEPAAFFLNHEDAEWFADLINDRDSNRRSSL